MAHIKLKLTNGYIQSIMERDILDEQIDSFVQLAKYLNTFLSGKWSGIYEKIYINDPSGHILLWDNIIDRHPGDDDALEQNYKNICAAQNQSSVPAPTQGASAPTLTGHIHKYKSPYASEEPEEIYDVPVATEYFYKFRWKHADARSETKEVVFRTIDADVAMHKFKKHVGSLDMVRIIEEGVR